MAKAKEGRPTKYKPDFHPHDFVRLSKEGKTLTQISDIWDVDKGTLYNWSRVHPEFFNSLKRGRQSLEAYWVTVLQSAIFDQVTFNGRKSGFNLGAFVWFTRNALKWTDRVDEKPVDKARPLIDLTDEELQLVLDRPDEE